MHRSRAPETEPITKSFSFLLLLAASVGPASSAGAQLPGDCHSGAMPPELADFPQFPFADLLSTRTAGQAGAARLALGTTAMVALHPVGGFAPRIPVVIRPNPPFVGPLPFQRPRAGGFVSFAIVKAGAYRLATREAWEAMEVLSADQALAKVEPTATAYVFCSIGRIQDYTLAPGTYVVQFVSTYSDHAYLELVERRK